jgi:hypothetical protein
MDCLRLQPVPLANPRSASPTSSLTESFNRGPNSFFPPRCAPRTDSHGTGLPPDPVPACRSVKARASVHGNVTRCVPGEWACHRACFRGSAWPSPQTFSVSGSVAARRAGAAEDVGRRSDFRLGRLHNGAAVSAGKECPGQAEMAGCAVLAGYPGLTKLVELLLRNSSLLTDAGHSRRNAVPCRAAREILHAIASWRRKHRGDTLF